MTSPARVSVRIDRPALDKFVSWNGEFGEGIERLAKDSVRFAKVYAPKRTGHLAASISYTKFSSTKGLSFTTGSKARHALWMEQGTLPHVIEPRKRDGMLVFHWPKVGRTVFLRHVLHPGTKPYRYLQQGLDTALARFNA
jgi:hypothetical protein